MKKFTALICSLLVTATAYADNTKDVNVVNTPTVNANIVSPDPIPVEGTVDIAGPVVVSGPVDTNIVNTPSVNVTNFPNDIVGIEPYSARDNVCEVLGNRQVCYFDVPPGKLLKIEKVTGFTGQGNVSYLTMQGKVSGDQVEAYWLPRIWSNGNLYFYDASGPVYFDDSDLFTDAAGAKRDYRVLVASDGVGSVATTYAYVAGQLFPAN